MACAPTHLVWHFYHLAPVTVGGERSAVEPGEPDLVQRTGTFHGMNGWMDGWMDGWVALRLTYHMPIHMHISAPPASATMTSERRTLRWLRELG